MKPIIALVGRPNVGKSTLFNRLTRSRNALVADQPGLTRDRIYGHAKVGAQDCIVIDTAGLGEETDEVHGLMARQARQAMAEASVIVFMVDGRAGLTGSDQTIAATIRILDKPCFVAANKAEGLDPALVAAEFYALGLGQPYAISAAHGDGVTSFLEEVLAAVPLHGEEDAEEAAGIKVAVAGRPNVGKSTLVNRLLGEERVVVYDQPGTTRDSIHIPFARDGQMYTLIDTAGMRRRGRIDDTIEKFSVVKTLQAIDSANVVVLVLDAREGVTDQDANVAGFILESGRALVIAVNKWDGLDPDHRERVKAELDRKLVFLKFAKLHFISALHGSNVGNLFESIQLAYAAATRDLSTSVLNRILNDASAQHAPPLVNGRRIKLRYAHQGGRNPPVIVIHGNQTAAVPDAYQRYLVNTFRDRLELYGTPVRVEFRTGDNPYKHRRNKLSPRQVAKRKRLMRFVKGKAR